MAINDVSLTSGMRSNLLSLQSTVDLLNRTQNRLSTGKKVNTAMDNPVSFFASQALTSRAATIDSLKDAMGQAVQTITAADKGITAITSMIEQAKGIAQSALSAEASSGYDTETVTLNTVVAGNSIAIGGTTLTAGPSGVATSTSLDNQTITFAANADVGDTIEMGGITFTAAQGSTTAVGTISVDMSVNTLIAGDTVTVGGVSYTAVASTSNTVYDSFGLNLHNTAVGDQFTIGGVAYTAVASTATTTYNHFTIDFTGLGGDDTIQIGGQTYTATTAAHGSEAAGQFSVADGIDAAKGYVQDLLMASVDGGNFAFSGMTGNTFDITAADGNTLNASSVQVTGGITSTADTTETTDPITATQFRVGTTDALTADNLMDSINAHQAGVFTIVNGAGTNGNNLLTFSASASSLSATSVQITTNNGSATLTNANHAVDTTVVGANQFVISGDAGMDAENLRAKINALQGTNYTAAGAGATITIVADTGTTLAADTVSSTDGAIAISSSVTTSAATLGQFQFGVGADANATAASLAAKLTGFFGAQFGVANASGSNVITITSGTTDLSLTTVQAGTDADSDMVIASTTSTSTADAYDATHFAVTGNNATDAAAMAEKINGNAAITAAGFSATASNGVLSIANDSANVAAGDVVVVGGTMTEATVQGSNELSSLQGQYNEMLNQIDALVDDSGYKGKNLLDNDTLTVKFEGANLDVVGFNAKSSGLGLNAATWSTAGVAETAIDASINALDGAMTTLQSQSSKLSGNLSIISVRQDFSTNMINTLTAGSDKLTAADANEEGANMLMLQTRQSLSTTALSLSAQAAQSVLRLFQ